MISLVFFVLAIIVFLLAAFKIGNFDHDSLLFFGLAFFAAGHLPWSDFNYPRR